MNWRLFSIPKIGRIYTDMAKFRDPQRTNNIIQNWMRTRSTIEFLGLWEQLHNTNFNSIEFDAFKKDIQFKNGTTRF